MPKTVDRLSLFESGRVLRVTGRDAYARRLAELGVTKGAHVQLKKRAPARDPLEINVRGGALTLRNAEARRIELMDEREALAHERELRASARERAFETVPHTPLAAGRNAKIALLGNPNAGKTTLYNALTGAREQVGNRAGVTVECKTRRVKTRFRTLTICDLPGVYALGAISADERAACAFLERARPNALIDVIDATNLERNLGLALQAQSFGLPIVYALSMMDELKKSGARIDVPALEKALGAPVVPICARTGQGVSDLLAALERVLCQNAAPKRRYEADAFLAAETRYAEAERITKRCFMRGKQGRAENAPTPSDGIDRALMSRLFGVPLFLLIMTLMFTLTFDTVGAYLSEGAEALVSLLSSGVKTLLRRSALPAFFADWITDGALAGVSGVVAFLPQIALLFFFLSLLEDSGYLARTAFLTDRLLRRFGLTGKSFIPLLMGFGCTVPATMCARTMESDDARKMTILLLPFLSCSAKLPVYGMIVSVFFPRARALVIIGLYALGAICGAATGAVFRKSIFRRACPLLMMELPPYRLPTAKNTLWHVAERVEHFLSRAGTLICLMSVVLWFFTRVTPALLPTDAVEQSLLGRFGAWLSPLLKPLGLDAWQIGVALLSGLVAKEAVVSTLMLLGGESLTSLLSPASALAFLTFVLLYPPCAAALVTMRKELSSRGLTLLLFLWQTGFAYLAAFCVYRVASLLI